MKEKIFNGFEIVQDLIKLRWVPEILKSISHGHKKYSDILNSIPYMSHTELNRKLAILTDKRVIDRHVEDSNISYVLLSFGEDLVHIFNHLEDLEERYFQSS